MHSFAVSVLWLLSHCDQIGSNSKNLKLLTDFLNCSEYWIKLLIENKRSGKRNRIHGIWNTELLFENKSSSHRYWTISYNKKIIKYYFKWKYVLFYGKVEKLTKKGINLKNNVFFDFWNWLNFRCCYKICCDSISRYLLYCRPV